MREFYFINFTKGKKTKIFIYLNCKLNLTILKIIFYNDFYKKEKCTNTKFL